MNFIKNHCKICGSKKLKFFAHTAKCQSCGVLLNQPYPEISRENVFYNKKTSAKEIKNDQLNTLDWHIRSGDKNHDNFTRMAKFALFNIDRTKQINVLDYGGGGGQFALVAKSLFPRLKIFIVDLNDNRLLNEYKPLNNQIKFRDFSFNKIKFDIIFMNDVFEHLTFPLDELIKLRKKLKKDGKIFIDTPCTFWLYPLTKMFSKKLYKKILEGTVDFDHQQIWTKKSFQIAIKNSGYKISKFHKLSEYTQPPDFYLRNMKIKNPIIKVLGYIFYRLSPLIARNKIMSIIEK